MNLSLFQQSDPPRSARAVDLGTPRPHGNRPRARPTERLLDHLVDSGRISVAQRVRAGHLAVLHRSAVTEVLLAEGWLSEDDLLEARCDCFAATHVRLDQLSPDLALVRETGLLWCLGHRLLPWRRLGGGVVWVSAEPEHFEQIAGELPPAWGRPLLAVARAQDIEACLSEVFAGELATDAECSLDAADSCRSWAAPGAASLLVALALALVLALLAPGPAVAALFLLTVGVVAMNSVLKSILCFAAMRAPPAPDTGDPRGADRPPPLPRISVLVALLREAEVAQTLLQNLERLQYPRDLLEVVLVVEAQDDITISALSQNPLPRSFKVIEVPPGHVKTKPRALNYALRFCRGEVIGIYDAEDKPEPQQLLSVAEAFGRASPRVACVQARLDFFNATENWITRCFTAEYAGWFGLQLRGLSALGLPVPLGGTSVFIRRDALERVGRWDAFNVTEDADLGLRLHRHGYRTALVGSVTDEEATSRLWPWIRQRSRWIKGYYATYAVHMRRPRALLADLGWPGFLSMQALFLGAVLGPLTMPFLLLMLLAAAGVEVPGLPPNLLRASGNAMIALEAITLLTWALGIRQKRHRKLWWVLPLMHVYFLFSSIAALKAMGELVARPFYWDKTRHGVTRHSAGD